MPKLDSNFNILNIAGRPDLTFLFIKAEKTLIILFKFIIRKGLITISLKENEIARHTSYLGYSHFTALRIGYSWFVY